LYRFTATSVPATFCIKNLSPGRESNSAASLYDCRKHCKNFKMFLTDRVHSKPVIHSDN
jgi:hypothetical protein